MEFAVSSTATRQGLRQAAGALCLAALATVAWADRVELADGRVLEGRFAKLPGVATNPLDATRVDAAGESILMCDDELTRTMVAKRRVVKVEEAPVDLGLERVRIQQRVPENGRRIAGLGAILQATPFDPFGRRILGIATADGRVDIVQGITEITPRWTRIEGIQTEKPLLLDMRVATSSIPRDVLGRVIAQQIDRTNPDQRLQVVRLLMQGGRYEDANHELDGVIADFPELASLKEQRREIAGLAARQVLDEIRMRARVGQPALAMRLLDGFPIADADGELLEEVREDRDEYRTRVEKAGRLVAAIRDRLAALDDPATQARATAIVDEIQRGFTFAALERLATFDRVGTDPATPPDRGLALAISGWLLGAANAGDNLKLALSAASVRDLVREYLRSTDQAARDAVLVRIKAEEAADAPTIAALAAHMPPPIERPAATSPGLHEFAVPTFGGGDPVSCLVHLPPEYDPLRRYPAVLSLHASWSTPLNQVEWWAGMPGPDGVRVGQASRNGTIVIAPAWSRPNQTGYEYSAREHVAVLSSLREAMKRFAIDGDRVFLSGHSMGGDAAWDIALAHPDLWAGLIAITPTAGRYVNHYAANARSLPIYVVGGELDRSLLARNAMDLDRYFFKGFDATYVEYRGRGHESFSDEILRIFDWMGRRRRDFFPREIDAVSMRPWDRFFWWVEMESAPPRTVVLPEQWPPPPGTRPLSIEARVGAANALTVRCGADRVSVWLAPELVDFSRPITVTVDGRKILNGPLAPDVKTLLEDLRLRGDRQHPFWAVVEHPRPQR